MKVFLDLDGTLIDNRLRIFTLFCKLVPECQWSIEEYWNIRRNNINQYTLLKQFFCYSEQQIKSVNTLWLNEIETPGLLTLDSAFNNIHALLNELSQKKELFLVSARQNPNHAITQLKNLDLFNYFEGVYFTKQKKSKLDLIRRMKIMPEDVFAGDTGDDIILGKKLNAKTVAVYSGNLNRDILLSYQPTEIVSVLTSSIVIWN